MTLAEAATRLYMEPRAFLRAFDRDPIQALAHFTSDLKHFGKLRTYVGAKSLQMNVALLKRYAKRYIASLPSTPASD